MPNYGIDLNIGRPTTKQLSQPVDGIDLADVISAVKAVNETAEEAVLELKKITLGTGLVTGTDLSEEEPE